MLRWLLIVAAVIAASVVSHEARAHGPTIERHTKVVQPGTIRFKSFRSFPDRMQVQQKVTVGGKRIRRFIMDTSNDTRIYLARDVEIMVRPGIGRGPIYVTVHNGRMHKVKVLVVFTVPAEH